MAPRVRVKTANSPGTAESDPAAPTITADQVRKGIRVFVACTVVGLAAAIYWSSLVSAVTHLLAFRVPFLGLAAALAAFDLFAAAARIYIFASRVSPRISYWACWRAAASNLFMGGITPSHTGGAVGQIYVLYKEGMAGVDAAVVSFLGGFLSTIVVFLIAAVLLPLWKGAPASTDSFEGLTAVAVLVFGLAFLLVLAAAINPRRYVSGLELIVEKFPRLASWTRKRGVVDGWSRLVHRYHEIMLFFWRNGKWAFAGSLVVTSLIYVNKFLIAYVVLAGLGVQADLLTVLYLQFVLMLLYYFAPTPGAAGVGEVVALVLMVDIIPSGFEGSYIVLWRFFTLYAGMLIGAYITIHYLYRTRVIPAPASPCR